MDPISEYQKWKQQGESLRAQAKEAMETRFRELLTEAVQIAQEYHRDFGVVLKPPAIITTFRYKAAASKTKKAAKGAPQRKEAPVASHVGPNAVSKAGPPDPKIAGLERRRVQIQKKLAATKDAGKPTKNLEDKLYEIEDELRLAGQIL